VHLVQRGDDGLFDLRPGEALARRRQAREVEGLRVLLVLRQVNPEDILPALRLRQVDEENLVEAAFPEQLGGAAARPRSRWPPGTRAIRGRSSR